MLFNKNKRKIDSRIRFQNPNFRQRLNDARMYKRRAKSLPDTKWTVFLSKVGLGSWPARVITVLIFFALIYIVFIPNLLFIKTITVKGADQAAADEIKTQAQLFMGQKAFWPQKNILFFSKNRFAKFLIKQDREVLSVNKVSKKFPNTLIIDIAPRADTFTIQTETADYIISGDGLVTQELANMASTTLPSGLILIKLTGSEELALGQKALDPETADFISALQNSLANITKVPTDHYEIASLNSADVTVYNKNGLKLLFDVTLDQKKVLQQLSLLYSQFLPGDISRLNYIDMRFDGKAYTCFNNTPCVKNINLPKSNSTSTPTGFGN